MEKGSPILNITIRKLVESGKIKCLKVKPLINALVNEYNNNYIDIEGLSSVRLST